MSGVVIKLTDKLHIAQIVRDAAFQAWNDAVANADIRRKIYDDAWHDWDTLRVNNNEGAR